MLPCSRLLEWESQLWMGTCSWCFAWYHITRCLDSSRISPLLDRCCRTQTWQSCNLPIICFLFTNRVWIAEMYGKGSGWWEWDGMMQECQELRLPWDHLRWGGQSLQVWRLAECSFFEAIQGSENAPPSGDLQHLQSEGICSCFHSDCF